MKKKKENHYEKMCNKFDTMEKNIDEIISDYGWNGNKIYNHSSFGGRFPKSLNGFFPWHSFYDGTQIQYLNKEEYVAGAYGIETRYPFFDPCQLEHFLSSPRTETFADA